MKQVKYRYLDEKGVAVMDPLAEIKTKKRKERQSFIMRQLSEKTDQQINE